MYGKIFESIYEGTLAEDWRALVTFQQMIVLCDSDGCIDMTPNSISRRTGIPIEHIEIGISILESPDPYSRTQAEEGRRITRIDAHRPWGWMLVNHTKYRDLRDIETVREQTRERVRRHRESKNIKGIDPVTVGNGSNAKKRHTDTDTYNKDSSSVPPFDTFWLAYPKKENKQKSEKAFNKLSVIDQQAATDKLSLFISSHPNWQGTPNFIPLASTFLNGRRWEDEIKTNKPNHSSTSFDELSL